MPSLSPRIKPNEAVRIIRSKYVAPAEDALYVNSQWGDQDDPFDGDVINSYNDGPTEDGTIMGPFYEIEASSPAAALARSFSVVAL